MELVKTNETVNRTFDDESNVTDVVTSIQYKIEDNGAQVGNANVYQGGYSLNVNKQGGLDVLKAELEAIFVTVV